MSNAYRALELWERWFVEDGSPIDDMGDCIFCHKNVLTILCHADDCIYLAARELIGSD